MDEMQIKLKTIKQMINIKTPIGILFASASTKGLTELSWNLSAVKENTSHDSSNSYLWQVQRQLEEYFRGMRKEFSISLDIKGTPFQCQVWKELLKIPYGERINYQSLAERLRRPNSSRALANACGKNPFVIIVPCHRVVRKNGALGGYVAGPELKSSLLALEAASLARD